MYICIYVYAYICIYMYIYAFYAVRHVCVLKSGVVFKYPFCILICTFTEHLTHLSSRLSFKHVISFLPLPHSALVLQKHV